MTLGKINPSVRTLDAIADELLCGSFRKPSFLLTPDKLLGALPILTNKNKTFESKLHGIF